MKTTRFVPLALVLALSTVTFAQSGGHGHSDTAGPAAVTAGADAQKAFEKLKTLAGSWVGPLTIVPAMPSMEGKFAEFMLRVTSRGNALVHELSVSGIPDHPVTVFYVDGDRLLLTHYCDAGNRPRMVGKVSPDGKTVEFDFVDLSGGNQKGHMHHAVFTFIDDNRHTEDWTYMMPGDQPARAHFDLQRTSAGGVVSGK